MPKQILITGGLGFLGRHAARALAAAGHRVVGIGRGQWSPAFARDWGFADGRAWPITTETLDALNCDPDWILHCAGSGSPLASAQSPLVSLEDNIATAASVLEYARARAAKVKVVLVSSAAVYGNVGETPVTESQPNRPLSVYGNHKALAEDLARWYAREYRLSISITRLFSLYGVGLRRQYLWDACETFTRGNRQFAGTGEETFDFIHVDDAVKLLSLVAESASPLCPVWNGGSGQPIRANKVLSFINNALQVPSPIFVDNSDRPLCSAVADTTRARSLGFSPSKSWEQGLDEYVRWFRSQITTRRAAA